MRLVFLALLATVPFLSAAHQAQANSLSSLGRGIQQSPEASFLEGQRPTLAPFAQIRFCVRNPDECAAPQGSAVVQMTKQTRQLLGQVNMDINRSVSQIEDQSQTEQGDLWQIATSAGDCEDFALTKRQRLIREGIPSRALRIAIAHTSSGDGHAVLVVKTSDGDLVLDNRTNAIRPWNRTELQWIKIQSADNPRLWFAI